MDFAAIKDMAIEPLDTSHNNRRYLLRYNGRHYEVSHCIAVLVGLLRQDSISLSEIAARFSEITGISCSEHDMEDAIEKLLHAVCADAGKPDGKRRQFLFRAKLFQPMLVRRIADKLKFLFMPWLAVPAICIITISEILFYAKGLGIIKTLDGANGIVIVLVLGLFVLNSLFHEFGHAAACRYFNTENGDIGVGLYITFPVFYSDVTSIWKLRRSQRVVVNLGGVYFQSIFLLPFLIVYFLTGDDMCKLYIYATNMNFLLTLNPFLKFDGYWIMSDILGIPNLRQRSMEYVRALFGKKRKQKLHALFLAGVKPVEKVIAIVYSVISTGFFLYFFAYAIPRMIYLMFPQAFSNWKSIIIGLSQGNIPDTSEIFSNTISLILLAFMLLFILRSIIVFLRKFIFRLR